MHPRSRSHLWRHRHTSIARHGHKGQAYCSRFALAERFRRTVDRPNPSRVCGPHYCLGRGAPAPDPAMPCALLQRNQNPSGAEQGCVALSRRSASWNHQITRNPRRTSSPIRPDLASTTHTSLRREPQVPGDLLRAIFGNVTEPDGSGEGGAGKRGPLHSRRTRTKRYPCARDLSWG